jgi:hypothetical protein
MNASPAPTVFTFFKPLSTRFTVGIEITSPLFPKIQPFSPPVTILPYYFSDRLMPKIETLNWVLNEILVLDKEG